MLKFYPPQSHIHVIARGFLIHNNVVILCRVKGSQSFFLPGGHIEDGESAQSALIRELGEEMGTNDYRISDFLGVCENIFFVKEDVLQHEINLVFKVETSDNFKMDTKEDHIEFLGMKKEELKNCKILPTQLKDGLLEWLDTGKQFFKEIQQP